MFFIKRCPSRFDDDGSRRIPWSESGTDRLLLSNFLRLASRDSEANRQGVHVSFCASRMLSERSIQEPAGFVVSYASLGGWEDGFFPKRGALPWNGTSTSFKSDSLPCSWKRPKSRWRWIAPGTIQGVPHYSVIELRAHELGQKLSRTVQQRHLQTLLQEQPPRASCPTCGTSCQLHSQERSVTSIDGPVTLVDLRGHCPKCRRAFFPLPTDPGL